MLDQNLETGETTDIYSYVNFANSYSDLDWVNNDMAGCSSQRSFNLHFKKIEG
jgi:hypothetical protein